MGKLHFNETALRYLAQTRPPDREGRLMYRKSNDSYRERWFRLCGNLLFYFRTNDFGAVSDPSDPIGVLVLTQCRVQTEAFGDRPFVFSIVFDGEEGRKHFFSGQSQQNCEDWVNAVRNFSHSSMLSQMEALRHRIHQLTGRDPLAKDSAKTISNTVKRPAPSIPPPPSNHRAAATFYVDSADLTELGRLRLDKFQSNEKSQSLRRDGCITDRTVERSVHMSSINTSSNPRLASETDTTIRVLPASASSFKNWEKFN